MRNNYDVSLTKEEKEQLIKNLVAITDYCKDLVKDIGTNATISAEWTFYDNVWGDQRCSISIERRFYHNNHEIKTTIMGEIGGLSIDFANDLGLEQLSGCRMEYVLSLLDYWKKTVKSDLLSQVIRRQKTRDLIKNFEL